jgi:hypothetical protein
VTDSPVLTALLAELREAERRMESLGNVSYFTELVAVGISKRNRLGEHHANPML